MKLQGSHCLCYLYLVRNVNDGVESEFSERAWQSFSEMILDNLWLFILLQLRQEHRIRHGQAFKPIVVMGL
jgi:hypothetical protein